MAAIALTAAYAADVKDLPKGPSLGDEKFTVHRAGMLSDVVPELAKQTNRQMYLNLARQDDGTGTPAGKAVTPVTLDFDGATLDVILNALCRQVGLVYRSQPWNRGIEIAEGDPDIDSRPTAEAGDYIVRAVGSTVSSSRSVTLGWGLVVPDTPDTQQSLSISLEITPKTPGAARYLAGVNTRVTATTDKGGKIEANAQGWGGGFQPLQRNDWGGGGGEPPPPPLQLPAPPAGVRLLTKVEGALRAYSVVKVADLKFKPGTEAQTVTADDVSATVKSWKTEGEDTKVSLEINAPALPRTDRNYYYSDRRIAVLVAKDGTKRFGMTTMSSGGENSAYKIAYQFNPHFYGYGGGPPPAPGTVPPAFEPDYLLLTVTRYGDADKTIPFVLENVPVP